MNYGMCISVLCYIELLGKCIVLYHIILNNVGLRAQKFHRYNKTVIDGRITMYISLYMSIYPVINRAISRMSTTRLFYFTRHFFKSTSKSIYLKYLKYLQSGRNF